MGKARDFSIFSAAVFSPRELFMNFYVTVVGNPELSQVW
jgi:hypothetical protein